MGTGPLSFTRKSDPLPPRLFARRRLAGEVGTGEPIERLSVRLNGFQALPDGVVGTLERCWFPSWSMRSHTGRR